MRIRFSLLITALAGALLMVPATASAYFVHVVAPGESLFSIAATDGLGVDQLAAANGLSPTTELIAGSTLQIPPQSGTAGDASSTVTPVATSTSTSTSSAGAYVVQPGDTLSGIAARAGLSPDSLAAANGLDLNGVLISGTVVRLSGSAAMVPVSTTVPVSTSSSSAGAYVVQPGDTLTAISARAGVSMPSLAAANGLDPNRFLISGTVLHLSGSPAVASSASAAVSQPVGAVAEGSPVNPPYPTPERVTAPQVGSIAAANGVPASLADAIAWQESGFNNDLVSSADARGVMQILPGTWDWIQHSLDTGGPALAPASASDNVRGGVLMLHSLLDATGGDPAMAAAGYYQGLPSVHQHGLYPDTQRYVQNVLALERQFGGGG